MQAAALHAFLQEMLFSSQTDLSLYLIKEHKLYKSFVFKDELVKVQFFSGDVLFFTFLQV